MLTGFMEHIAGATSQTGHAERRQSRRFVDVPSFDQHFAAFFPFPRAHAETLGSTTGSATDRRLSATTPAANLQRRRHAREG